MTLSAGHIIYIKELLDTSPISSELMKDDIVDHICCAVESKMKQGENFEKALPNVMSEFAPHGLYEIERESYLLLNYKYIIMKKFTYSFVAIACIATCVGLLAKMLHLDGANESLIFGLASMTVAVPMILFKPGMTTLERTRAFFALTSLAFITIGSSFKIMHLAGANVALVIGNIILVLGFIPLSFIKMYRESIAS